jgi:hypothetical protein
MSLLCVRVLLTAILPHIIAQINVHLIHSYIICIAKNPKTMQTKFIEGTNEQYSIREDGAVLSYAHGKIRIIKSFKGMVYIYIENVKITRGTNSLLYEYFGFKYCTICNCKMYNTTKVKCKNCRVNVANYPKTKDQIKLRNIKVVGEITKSYVSNLLRIKVGELDDKTYNDHKNLLEFKRKVSKEHKISIKKLK